MKGKVSFSITSPFGEFCGFLLCCDEEMEWRIIEGYCQLFNLSIGNAEKKIIGDVASWEVEVLDKDLSELFIVRAEFKYLVLCD